MHSFTEENYLKAIYRLTIENNNEVSTGTNEIAVYLGVKPATATDMLKKLKEKDYISYEKYGKSSLNQVGKSIAIEIIRKHRLWETFLHQVMEFSWDEVHEVALRLAIKAETDNGVQFSVELDYGTLFGLRNVSEEQAHPFLFGEAPRLMFPFARRIVADAVRDAGYPPLVLEPIDFNALYIQQLSQAQQMAETQPAGEA